MNFIGPFLEPLKLKIEIPLNVCFYRTNWWIITKLCL
jgi:hypothetical protein